MADASGDLVRAALRDFRGGGPIGGVNWDLLLRQARSAALLARIGLALSHRGLLESVPVGPRRYLGSAILRAELLAKEVRREARNIKAALRPIGAPVILLKGAAYVLADLPPASGRTFSDVDILVPRGRLDEVERALGSAGWHPKAVDSYDRHYYRDWMHQIPPLGHIRRQTTIDVHHTIVARTTRLQLEPAKLFAASVTVPGDPFFRTLAPADMVLHSATHLLNEGDFHRGLRDLDDLNLLLRHFGADPSFWGALLARAAELDLQRPLYYALRYTSRFLATPIPDEVRNARALTPPGALLRGAMDLFFERALRSAHESCRDRVSPVALWSLYIRSHLLLMPPQMLVPHLVRKALKGAPPQPPRLPVKEADL